MKRTNAQKSQQSPQSRQYGENAENELALSALKDKLRSNATGTDDDIAIDIQDSLGRATSLSLVVDNIDVTVEDGIVTLEGDVYRDEEKITAGDIAMAFTGDDNVNNYLRVMHNGN